MKKTAPNGGPQSSVSLEGDYCSKKVISETNAAVNKKSSFKSFGNNLGGE